MRRLRLRRRAVAALVVAAVLGGCGSSGDQAGDQAGGTAAGSPTTTAPSATTARDGPRGAARWETVATFSGRGDQRTEAFEILPDAIQWRVRFTCEGESPYRLTTTPEPRRAGPIGAGRCPGEEAFAIHTGQIRLGVEAPAGWTAVVDQQVDTPLDEPLLDAMATAAVEAEGSFYDLDKTGEGTARLFRAPDGRRFLRFEGFETPVNTDLFVWLTEAARPPDSATAFAAERVVLGNLKSTIGNQNYEIPPDVGIDIRSVVIWCDPIAIAYTAAPLESPA
ncbi:hypothetical protein BH20ACT2_BH20ACT2_01160 [soil metagenome]